MSSPPPSSDDRIHPVSWRTAGLVGLAALLFFMLSVGETAFWGDSASFASHLDTTPKPFARSYWLYKLLGRALSALGMTPAQAAAYASALFGAASIGLLHALCQRLTGCLAAAGLTAGSLAVAQTFWLHSSVAEVYTLLVLFEIGLIFLALGAPGGRREGLGLGALAGLALNHHRLLLFSLPVIAVYLWQALPRGRRANGLLPVGIGLALGSLPWLGLCLLFPPSSLSPPPGVTPESLWLQKVVLGGRWSGAQFGTLTAAGAAASLFYLAKLLALNFPSPAAVLAVLGGAQLSRAPGPRRTLLGGLLLAFIVAGSLFPWTGDQYAFFSPVLPLVALAAGLGLARQLKSSQRSIPSLLIAACLVMPPLLYAVLSFGPSADDSAEQQALLERQEFLWPPKATYTFPHDWARSRLQALPPEATLVSQWAEGTVFEYLQSEGIRSDVTLVLHRSGPLDLSSIKAPVFITWKPTKDGPPEAFVDQGLELKGEVPGLRLLKATE